MALRGFGFRTLIGSTPQPLIGTKVATAFNVTPDMYTGNTDPRSNPSVSTVVVTAGTGNLFKSNDRILVGPQGGPYDIGKVAAISTDTLTVQGLTSSHAVGEFVILSIPASSIYILANASPLYVGSDKLTASASSPYIAYYLNSGQIRDLGQDDVGNVTGTGGLWVWGTAADTFLASLIDV